MPSSAVRAFDDPDGFHAAFRGSDVKGVVTSPGNFHAELTRVDFARLWMQRGEESLPRVLNITSTKPERASIIFSTSELQPEWQVGGLAVQGDVIVVKAPAVPFHIRSAGACQWGSVSLAQQDLAAAGRGILGHELTLPAFAARLRPTGPLLLRLRKLHQAAGHLAKDTPDILAKHEVARAMEQALLEAMVSCVAGDPADVRNAYHHHAVVMRRFEQVLEANSEEPLYMDDLCNATGVSYRTLHACCREHLGMSPKRYLLLRRMHLAYRALRRCEPEKTSVTEIATDYGFWELGRFSVVYRSLYGESPSRTLRRPPDDPRRLEMAGANVKLAESA